MITARMKTLVSILAVLFAMGSIAVAQNMMASDDFDWDLYEPYGDVDVVYDGVYDNPDFGAIVLSHSTPTDQEANFDIVGPDDYWQHFDFSDDPAEEYVLDNLMPGTYSIAGTDENLELAHTIVEVRAGEVVDVFVTMQPWEQGAFVEGDYDPYGTYGEYEGYEDTYPGYPYGAYNVGPYETYDSADAGSILITNVSEGVDVVVTGPNGYSQSYEEATIVEGLAPGLYAIAASGALTDLSVTTVEIRAGQQLTLEPTSIMLEGQ